MTGRAPSGSIDPDRVTYGRYLEDALLAWVAGTHKGEVTPGASYHHPDHREYTAAPDGHLWHPDGTVSLIEAKTAMDAYQWGAEHTAEIPPKYLVQCAWQMYVTGARHVLVMMTLFAKDGTPKLVPGCTYPLTGLGCVNRVYSPDAIIECGPDGAVITEVFSTTADALLARLGDS